MSFHAQKSDPLVTARRCLGRSMSLLRTTRSTLPPLSLQSVGGFYPYTRYLSGRRLPSLTQADGPVLYQPPGSKREPPRFSAAKLLRFPPRSLFRSLKSVPLTAQLPWNSLTDQIASGKSSGTSATWTWMTLCTVRMAKSRSLVRHQASGPQCPPKFPRVLVT